MDVDASGISINQNILVLIIGLIGLGVSEIYAVRGMLYVLSFSISIVMTVFVLTSMRAYTAHYIKKKEKEKNAL